MEQKILIGVEHATKKELGTVVKEIDLYSPSSLGLELPEDYLMKERHGIWQYFFGDIAASVRNSTRVIPLERKDLMNYHHILETAKAVKEEKLKEEELLTEIKSLEAAVNPYMPPETIAGRLYFLRRYKATIEILNETKTLREILRLWRDSNKKREECMLKKIKENGPEIVVIGDQHALNLKDKLPEYEYKTFY